MHKDNQLPLFQALLSASAFTAAEFRTRCRVQPQASAGSARREKYLCIVYGNAVGLLPEKFNCAHRIDNTTLKADNKGVRRRIPMPAG